MVKSELQSEFRCNEIDTAQEDDGSELATVSERCNC